MWYDVLDHLCCKSTLEFLYTTFKPNQNVISCFEDGTTVPMRLIKPGGGPQVAKHDLNLISSFLRTWKIAPNSSLNKASITSLVSELLQILSNIISRPQCPANAISTSVVNKPPSERSW